VWAGLANWFLLLFYFSNFLFGLGLGVYISRIEENSVAERAGLRPGDTILEVNGTPFTSINHEEALKVSIQQNIYARINIYISFDLY